jgi:hypothetical protein
MKNIYKILILVIVDIIIIWTWIYAIDPDPSISIYVLVLVPFVFGLNLILAGIIFLLKKKKLARLFLINSVISSAIMYYLFGQGIDRHQNKRLESWTFQKSDTTLRLTRWKNIGEFSMSYSLRPGSSWSFIDGKCELLNNEWILKVDSTTMMKIHDDLLIGYPTMKDTIELTKIER